MLFRIALHLSRVWISFRMALTPASGEAPIQVDQDQVVFYPPEDQAQWEPGRQALARWKQQAQRDLRYDDSLYRRADLLWTQRNYSCGFLMLWDELFWDWLPVRSTKRP